MNMKLKILLVYFLGGIAINAADFDTDSLPEKLAAETQRFFDADTGRARAQIAAFSDDDLQRITTAFKKAHAKQEQRLFWLIEESYRRNAERVASERIRFLYIAVLLALGIIAAFSALTYAQARKLRLATTAAQTVAPATLPEKPARAKKPPKKGKRK